MIWLRLKNRMLRRQNPIMRKVLSKFWGKEWARKEVGLLNELLNVVTTRHQLENCKYLLYNYF